MLQSLTRSAAPPQPLNRDPGVLSGNVSERDRVDHSALVERVQREFMNENFPRNSSYLRFKQ